MRRASTDALGRTSPLSFLPQSLIYAGAILADNGTTLASYGVPPVGGGGREVEAGRGARSADPLRPFLPPAQGCQALVAIETARLTAPHDADSPFWD